MLSPFFCGTFHQEEDDEPWSSPSSTPRRSRKNSFCKHKDSKNPYSTRGLDKFSALLSDLEEKRQQIYSQTGAQDISFVRFVYSNSNDCTPIVVKLKDKKQEKTNLAGDTKDKPITHNSEAALDKYPIESSAGSKDVKLARMESDKKTMKKRLSWNIMKLDRLWRPSYYLPAAIILILVLLAVFGRSVAILCTSLGWYLVPTIKARSENSRRPAKKKEYVRRLSENKMVSDGLSSGKSSHAGVVKEKSAGEHGHRKSW
ncbi:hypothetical protein L1049_026655 [Liquidambar formosana]|uniref:ZCF37 n=1 Tax=Liquidambar formosana TaxID=63359 RepID=A0AAP0R917_LIQFO